MNGNLRSNFLFNLFLLQSSRLLHNLDRGRDFKDLLLLNVLLLLMEEEITLVRLLLQHHLLLLKVKELLLLLMLLLKVKLLLLLVKSLLLQLLLQKNLLLVGIIYHELFLLHDLNWLLHNHILLVLLIDKMRLEKLLLLFNLNPCSSLLNVVLLANILIKRLFLLYLNWL